MAPSLDPSRPSGATIAEPDRAAALAAVRRDAADCRNCPLWEINTQTVFGEGPAAARVLFVAEAPGAQEDAQGRPFVGPAGRIFVEALTAAGLSRDEVYVTNTVKHRPWIQGAGRGRNRPPRQSEINACRPWLQQELRLVQPRIVCCLGAVAAREVIGRDFKLTQQRGQWLSGPAAPHLIATLHPSYILKQPPQTAETVRATLFEDVRRVAERYREITAA